MAIDLHYSSSERALRAEARAWLSANVPSQSLPSFDTAAGFEAHRAWERRLYEGGWGMVTWPREYGGRGLNLIEWLVFEEEYYRAGAPGRVNQNGLFLFGPTLMEFGTPAQKSRFLPRLAAGDDIWAQAWSEPQAGSDMAAIRSTATRVGDEYVIRGHKIWSSRAVFADWCFGLFRTKAGSERHKGLSYIVVPLSAPGVRVRGIAQIDGKPGFAEIFFDDVRVPAANRIGGEDEGWNIAMATAGFERGLMLRSPARFQMTAKRLVELYRKHAARCEPGLATMVAEAWLDAEAYCLSTYATAARLIAGGSIGVESSANKVFWSELDIAMHRAALSILGAHAALMRDAGQSEQEAGWMEGFLFSLAGPIYAGANEIQRNIIAERFLKMARS